MLKVEVFNVWVEEPIANDWTAAIRHCARICAHRLYGTMNNRAETMRVAHG